MQPPFIFPDIKACAKTSGPIDRVTTEMQVIKTTIMFFTVTQYVVVTCMAIESFLHKLYLQNN